MAAYINFLTTFVWLTIKGGLQLRAANNRINTVGYCIMFENESSY